jgi:hypothetical protein
MFNTKLNSPNIFITLRKKLSFFVKLFSTLSHDNSPMTSNQSHQCKVLQVAMCHTKFILKNQDYLQPNLIYEFLPKLRGRDIS